MPDLFFLLSSTLTMDSSSDLPFADGEERPTPRSQLQIQGPRPPPLSLHKESHKIKKPPRHPEQTHNHNHHQQHQRQHPVIIYAVSPKPIYVTVSDFMTTVQRLTGPSSGDENVSPAARMASLEKVMNSPKEKCSSASVIMDGMAVIEHEGDGGGGGGGGEGEMGEMGRVPGILSPAVLPPVVQDMYFSPAPALADPFGLSVMHGNYGFLTSPSGLFSGFVGSPVLSPDFFGDIWNF